MYLVTIRFSWICENGFVLNYEITFFYQIYFEDKKLKLLFKNFVLFRITKKKEYFLISLYIDCLNWNKFQKE